MSHSEILLDIEHEVLYFLGTPSTIEDLRLREFGLPLVSPLEPLIRSSLLFRKRSN